LGVLTLPALASTLIVVARCPGRFRLQLLREGAVMKLWCLLTAMGLTVAGWVSFAAALDKKTETRVFELRTYHSAPGKMKALHARFRDHTNKLFEKHGMTVIGFWNPIDSDKGEQTLIYLLAFPSKEDG